MRVFDSLEAVDAAQGLPENVRRVARRILSNLVDALAEHGEAYDPAVYGATVVVERGDTDADAVRVLGYPLTAAVLEGATLEDGCFVTCTLHDNEFGYSIVVPDADWLDPALREKLLAELAPEGA
ncbi:MAG: hypothetical protein ACOCX4_09635 [Planctomycetota bacterium]